LVFRLVSTAIVGGESLARVTTTRLAFIFVQKALLFHCDCCYFGLWPFCFFLSAHNPAAT
jgi:hypothetical protein